MRRKAAKGLATNTLKIDVKEVGSIRSGRTEIDVKDFGPIRSGRIEIAPMTVLTGPNNSGKSYAALLIRSIFGRGQVLESYARNAMMNTFRLSEMMASAIDGNTPARDDVADNVMDEFFNNFQEEVLHNMKRDFSADLASLIRIGSRKCTIGIQTNRMITKIIISKNRSTCKVLPLKKLDIKVNVNQNTKLECEVDGDSITMDMPILDNRFFKLIMPELMRVYLKSGGVFYLPAARSGILQGHRAISASIVKQAPYMGLEKVDIPKLSGVVSDFMVDIIEMPTKRGPFYDIASDLEKEILQGRIEIEQQRHPTSDIKYVYKQREIPLHLASSTVSEIAPFILYLKYMISEESTLILEEPEAHLNPRNQAIFVKYLVRLVRRGLMIVLTTHSPFIVDRISNLVQAGRIVANRRTGTANPGNADLPGNAGDGGSGPLLANLGLGPNDYLLVDEVASYAFEPSRAGDGIYDIRRHDVEKDDGIPAEEFVKTNEALYRESLAIQDNVNN